ncbi:MAG: four helix bundle protein [candidate division Zixibacteria bacterium]|nr:four helix bundle protein [candidate division Zixibacteria bacterium]
MPVYEKFEDLPVWKLAKDLTVKIYKITKGEKFRRDYGLVDQIRRASISISSNIAEGFERGSKKEFIQFLYIAKGSLGEVRSQLQVCFELGYINKENLNSLLSQSYDLSNQLGAFISSIKKRIRS